MELPYPVKPIHPSPVVRWTNGNLSATRQFVVPSENVDDFIEYMLTTSGGCGLPTTFPGWPTVFVDNIEASPISACCFATPDGLGYLKDPATELEGYPSSGGSDANDTCWWKVIIGYATKEVLAGQSGVREGTWVNYERNMSGEVVSIPSRNLYWDAFPTEQIKDDARGQIFVPLADINMSWNFVDEADMCEIESSLVLMQGKVNNAAYGSFLFPGECSDPWEPETLLFLGYSTSLEVGTRRIFGSYCTAVESKRTLNVAFKMRRVYGLGANTVVGWNHDYYDGSKSTAGWYRPIDSSGNYKYPSATFANIFI